MVTEGAARDERFRADDLDRTVWLPYYLAHWSSRVESAATKGVRDSALRLTIPRSQGRWCADLLHNPLRVSCIQSGTWSGPLGSERGQQPFRPGLVVREEQPPFRGYTPHFGRIEIRMRGVVTERSMVACWMVGFEDQPEPSGEICIAEIFGDAMEGDVAAVGMGVHAFRDPALHEAFATERVALDPAELHTYAVDWRRGSLDFAIEGRVVRHLDQAPDYPMQLMIGVFDFPAKAVDGDEDAIPELVVSHVRGQAPADD